MRACLEVKRATRARALCMMLRWLRRGGRRRHEAFEDVRARSMATSLAEMLIFARPLKAESYGLLVSQKPNIAL